MQGLTAVDGLSPRRRGRPSVERRQSLVRLHLHFDVLKGVPADAVLMINAPAFGNGPERWPRTPWAWAALRVDRHADYGNHIADCCGEVVADVASCDNAAVTQGRTATDCCGRRCRPAPVDGADVVDHKVTTLETPDAAGDRPEASGLR